MISVPSRLLATAVSGLGFSLSLSLFSPGTGGHSGTGLPSYGNGNWPLIMAKIAFCGLLIVDRSFGRLAVSSVLYFVIFSSQFCGVLFARTFAVRLFFFNTDSSS